jgi:hypothetical protein
LYRSVAQPIYEIRRGFHGEGSNPSSHYERNLEGAVDEYYDREIFNSFGKEIREKFDIIINSPLNIYLSRRSLEAQVA